MWVLDRPDFCLGDPHRKPGRSLVGVVIDGEGNAAMMSDIDPGRDPRGEWFLLAFSFSSSMPRKPSRLAVLPRSRFDASLVALLMSSGRLLELPLPSFSLTASRFSLAGFFSPLSLIESGVVLKDEVPLGPSAPPFSRPPRTCWTLGSRGVVGVPDPDVGTLPPLDVAALGLNGAGIADVSSNWEYNRELSGSNPLGDLAASPSAAPLAAVAAIAPSPLDLPPLPAGEDSSGRFTSCRPSPLLICFNAGFPAFPMLTFLTRILDSSWSPALD